MSGCIIRWGGWLVVMLVVTLAVPPLAPVAGVAGSSVRSASYLDLLRGADDLYRIRTDDGARLIYIHCSRRSCYKVYGSSAV